MNLPMCLHIFIYVRKSDFSRTLHMHINICKVGISQMLGKKNSSYTKFQIGCDNI